MEIIINLFESYKSNIIAALLGAFGSLIAFYFKEKYSLFLKKKSFALSLLAEVEALEKRYLTVTYPYMKQSYEDYGLFSVIIKEDYFTIFNNNCRNIGILSNSDAAKIVSLYVETKGFMDILRNASANTEKVEALYLNNVPTAPILKQKVSLECKSIIDDHENILTIVKKLKTTLKKISNMPWYCFLLY